MIKKTTVAAMVIGLLIGNSLVVHVKNYDLSNTVQAKQKTIDSLLIVNKYELIR